MGSLLYMSPEQFNDSKNADHLSDIYSLGRMLYEIFSDAPIRPFVTNTKGLPSGIIFVINKATEDNPEHRFQHASELRESFNIAIDVLLSEGSKQEVNRVIMEIMQADVINQSVIGPLLQVIPELLTAPDNVHDIIMKMDSALFTKLEEVSEEGAFELVTSYVEYVISQGWSFGYTDKIASKALELFNSMKSPEIKARLMYAVAEVGVSHNRWFVIGRLNDMLYSISDAGEALIIYDYLKNKKSYIKRANDVVSVEKQNIHSLLLKLYE